MGALIIVLLKPIVKIPLELVQISIQFLPEGDPVELVQDRLVERLAYARGVVFLETLGMNALNEEIFPHSASYRK